MNFTPHGKEKNLSMNIMKITIKISWLFWINSEEVSGKTVDTFKKGQHMITLFSLTEAFIKWENSLHELVKASVRLKSLIYCVLAFWNISKFCQRFLNIHRQNQPYFYCYFTLKFVILIIISQNNFLSY